MRAQALRPASCAPAGRPCHHHLFRGGPCLSQIGLPRPFRGMLFVPLKTLCHARSSGYNGRRLRVTQASHRSLTEKHRNPADFAGLFLFRALPGLPELCLPARLLPTAHQLLPDAISRHGPFAPLAPVATHATTHWIQTRRRKVRRASIIRYPMSLPVAALVGTTTRRNHRPSHRPHVRIAIDQKSSSRHAPRPGHFACPARSGCDLHRPVPTDPFPP